jgi:hypothetical protein
MLPLVERAYHRWRAGDIEGEQHQPARVQDVLEPQRFRTRPQTAAHGDAVQQRA